MQVSAEAMGPKSAADLFAMGADEVLMPCINRLEDAAAKAGRVAGPVTLHVPANRVGDPPATLDLLREQGIERLLVVSGNPGHGRGTRTIYQLIPFFRSHGLHVSVGAYPEDYFTATSARHRARSAGILVDKQAAGAQRIITQACFKPDNAHQWLTVVRSRGVMLPIHFGVMAPVPRKALASVLRATRSEFLRHPRLRTLNRENLDLLYRMVRSMIPKPERFMRALVSQGGLSDEDGFHLFAHGSNVQELIAAAHAIAAPSGRSDSPQPLTSRNQ